MITNNTQRIPHDKEAEQAILGSILFDNGSIESVIEKIESPVAFFLVCHQIIFGKMLELHQAEKPIDEILLGNSLELEGQLEECGGLAYISSLIDCSPDIKNIDLYIDIVIDKFNLRELIVISSESTRVAGKRAEEAIDESVSKLTKLSESLVKKDRLKPIKKILFDSFVDLEKVSQNQEKIVGLPTGFIDIDNITLGLHPTDLIIIAGRPGSGKTALSLNIAHYAAHLTDDKGDVLIFSYEMGSKQLVMRIAGSCARIDTTKLRNGNMTQDEWDRLASATDEISRIPIFIDDSMPTLEQMIAISMKHDKKSKVSLVVLDYMQLVPVSKKTSSREQEVANISRSMKKLAKELNCPVIALSQLNRSLENRSNKRPMLSDLRECLAVDSTLLFTQRGVLCNSSSHMLLHSLNSKTGKIEMKNSTDIPKINAQTIIVRVRSGREIKCTPNHPFLTDIGWVKACDLTDKMSIAGANKILHNGETHIEEARLIGWMLGNGSMVGSNSPSFICSDKDLADYFCETITKCFGLTPKTHKHKCKKVFQYDITGGPVRTKKGNIFKDWLREKDLWGRTAIHKEIPEWFLSTADDKSIAEIIGGLIDTDGSIPQYKGLNKYPNIKYSTSSLKMAHQFMYCLARIGVYGRIDKGYMSVKFNKHLNYNVTIGDPEQISRFKKVVKLTGIKGIKLDMINIGSRVSNFGNRVGIWAGKELVKLARINGISQEKLGYRDQKKRISQNDLKFYLNKIGKIERGHEIGERLSSLINSNIYWDQFDYARDGGIVELFDRNVPGNHNFVANGLIVHNSGALEQDSDIIMFIYRDEVYNEESPDKGTAEINIAKHRNGSTGTVRLSFIGKYTKFANFTSNIYG